MDTSMNMISALSAGSGFGALTSDSIPSLLGDNTMDFQSLLLGMMKNTESPVSEAFESNDLLKTDLMASLFPRGSDLDFNFEDTNLIGFTNPNVVHQLVNYELNQMDTSKDKDKTSLAAGLMDISVKMQELNVTAITKQVADIREAQTAQVTEITEEVPQKTPEEILAMMTETKPEVAEKILKEVSKLQQVEAKPEVIIEAEQTEAEPAVMAMAEKPVTKQQELKAQPVQINTEPKETAQQVNQVTANQNLGTEQQMPAEVVQKMPAEHVMSEAGSTGNYAEEPTMVKDGLVPEEKTQTIKTESEKVDVLAEHQTNAAETRESAQPMLEPLTSNVKVEPVVAVPLQEAQPVRQTPVPAYVQVAEQVEMAVAEGKEELTMQLSPEGLGEISVRLAKVGTKLSISITAANPETHNLLLSHSHDLVRALNLTHVNVEGVQVQTQQGETTDTPVAATNGYDFNQSVDVNKEGQQREHQGTHHFNQSHQGDSAGEQESQREMNETLEMLRAEMSRLNYLA